jgi:hypothetical protein
MRAQNDARNKLALAFRDYKRPSAPPSLVAADALSCVAGSHQRMFLHVKLPGREEILGIHRREVLSVNRWTTAAVLFGTATNTRFVELAFDVSRTGLHDALVYGPWRVAGPFRVERFVDRFSTSEVAPDEAWKAFIAT